MACDHLEKVDPRVRRTRKLLQEALGSLMHERDFGSISVQDVTERATVNRATFYAHFADKQALLESMVQSQFQEFVSGRFPEFPELNATTLAATFATIIEFVERSVSGCPKVTNGLERVLESALRDEVFGMFRHWLSEKPRHPFQGHKGELVATVLTTSVLGVACHWGQAKRKVAPKVLANALVSMLVPGDSLAATAY